MNPEEIIDRDTLAGWLVGQDRETTKIIAYRIVMRIAPLWIHLSEDSKILEAPLLPLPALRKMFSAQSLLKHASVADWEAFKAASTADLP